VAKNGGVSESRRGRQRGRHEVRGSRVNQVTRAEHDVKLSLTSSIHLHFQHPQPATHPTLHPFSHHITHPSPAMPRAPKSPATKKPSKATIKPKRSSTPSDGDDIKPSTKTVPKPSPRKAEPWTPEQDLLLFHQLYEKKKNPDWGNVAENVGRDKKVTTDVDHDYTYVMLLMTGSSFTGLHE
jgi:hypothetical protein